MKLAMSCLQHVLELSDESIASLVVENGRLFREIVEGLYECIEHGDDRFVLSENGVDLNLSDSLELLTTFVPFTLNTKSLLAALAKRLEKRALSPENRVDTVALVEYVKAHIRQLTLDISHEVLCDALTIASLIKACGLAFSEDDSTLGARLIAYFRLMRELAGSRIFILVNSRSYFTDSEMAATLEVCLAEHFVLLLIDGVEHPLLKEESRLLVDNDLCEITRADDIMV